MRAGTLRHRMVLQQPSGTSGDGYSDVTKVWAAIDLAAAGSETLRFGAAAALAPFRIRLRFRTDIRAEWRVTDIATGRVFQINGYGDPDDRRRELWLFATEIQ